MIKFNIEIEHLRTGFESNKIASSETSPSIGLFMNILCRVALELYEHLLWSLEVFPGPLGSDIDPAVGIASPAVLAGVEEVVGVCVGQLLHTVVPTTVQPVLRLQGRRELPRTEVVPQRETY